jgi:hypothetical protein
VKEVPPAAAAWAGEYAAQQQQQQGGGASVWGDEFAAFQAQQHPAASGAKQWADEFAGAGRFAMEDGRGGVQPRSASAWPPPEREQSCVDRTGFCC